MNFMIVDIFRDIFSCGTHVFVYALVHVMCLCVYVSMVCQRCMLYDDMYLHDIENISLEIKHQPKMCKKNKLKRFTKTTRSKKSLGTA